MDDDLSEELEPCKSLESTATRPSPTSQLSSSLDELDLDELDEFEALEQDDSGRSASISSCPLGLPHHHNEQFFYRTRSEAPCVRAPSQRVVRQAPQGPTSREKKGKVI